MTEDCWFRDDDNDNDDRRNGSNDKHSANKASRSNGNCRRNDNKKLNQANDNGNQRTTPGRGRQSSDYHHQDATGRGSNPDGDSERKVLDLKKLFKDKLDGLNVPGKHRVNMTKKVVRFMASNEGLRRRSKNDHDEDNRDGQDDEVSAVIPAMNRRSPQKKLRKRNKKEAFAYGIENVSNTAHTISTGNYLIDSGTTSHMTPYKRDLDDYIADKQGLIAFGDDSTVSYIGSGTLNGKFDNTLLVPDLKTGLLSVSVLDMKGYKVIFQNGMCRVLDKNSNIYCTGILRNGLYYLDTPVHALTTTSINMLHNSADSRTNEEDVSDDGDAEPDNTAIIEQERRDQRDQKVHQEQAREKSSQRGRAPRGSRAASSSSLGMNKLESLHQRYGHLGVSNIKKALRQRSIVGAGVTYDENEDETVPGLHERTYESAPTTPC